MVSFRGFDGIIGDVSFSFICFDYDQKVLFMC